MMGQLRNRVRWAVVFTVGSMLLGCGGVPLPIDGDDPGLPPSSDAEFIGSAACQACHPNLKASHSVHGHSQALKMPQGAAPIYPPEGEWAGVPDPPPGFEWFDIDFVIGGYLKGANFVDSDGFVLIDDAVDEPVQFNLRHPANGTTAGYVPFVADDVSEAPYDFACFRCHTTGAVSLAANGGLRQGNLPGIGGTWAEPGVQCEACHGPGSEHIPDPSAGRIVVDSTAAACAACHAGEEGLDVLSAADGFIIGNQQAVEVAASPHEEFACTVCHDPHVSVVYDRDIGLRNQCLDCHAGQNMAFHQGKILAQGDYVERLSCESCHMPRASKMVSSASAAFTGGGEGRIGDTRTHIMFIDTAGRDFRSFFSPDGSQVVRDADGKAAVTVDFVCLRCHNGLSSAFALNVAAASSIADGIHNPR